MGVTFASEDEFNTVLSQIIDPDGGASAQDQAASEEPSDPTAAQAESAQELPEESKEAPQRSDTPCYKLTKVRFVELLKTEIDKIDPVDGIIADIEASCDTTEDGHI